MKPQFQIVELNPDGTHNKGNLIGRYVGETFNEKDAAINEIETKLLSVSKKYTIIDVY